MKKSYYLLSWLMACMLFWSASAGAEAAGLNPTEDFYVNDYADVLSEGTKKQIINKNIELEEKSGAQIVVVTTDSYGKKDPGAYTEDLFNDWGIGSSRENNGVLLVLFIEDDDYYALQGDGITGVISDAEVGNILDDSLEPHFDVKDYDKGVRAAFGAFYDQLDSYYDRNPVTSGNTQSGNTAPGAAGSDFSMVGIIIGIVVFIFIISVISSLFRPRRRRYHDPYYSGGSSAGAFMGGYFLGRRRRSWFGRRRYGAPPPPPPGPHYGAPPRTGAGRGTPSGTPKGGLFSGGGGSAGSGGAGRNKSAGSSRTSSPTWGSSGSSRSTGSGRSSSPSWGGSGSSRSGGGRTGGGMSRGGGGRTGGGGGRKR